MTYTYALILDPDWRTIFTKPAWDDPNAGASPLAQWYYRTKSHFNALPPADRILTALSRDDSYHIHWLWNDAHSPPTKYSRPDNLIGTSHPNLQHYDNHKNFLLASMKFHTPKTKTKPAASVPGAIPVNTAYGLMNANAGNDAIIRMLTQKKHQIHHIVILDPGSRIASRSQWRFPPSLSNPMGVLLEVQTAIQIAGQYPSIPLTVIT